MNKFFGAPDLDEDLNVKICTSMTSSWKRWELQKIAVGVCRRCFSTQISVDSDGRSGVKLFIVDLEPSRST